MSTNDTFTLLLQNTQTGATKGDRGETIDLWPLQVERLSEHNADIIVLNEVEGWEKNGHRQLARACDDLDMDALPLPPGQSGNGAAMLYRRARLGRWRRLDHKYAPEFHHGYLAAAFDMGVSHPVTVVACHIDPRTPDEGKTEAGKICWRSSKLGRTGKAGEIYSLIAGDINAPPLVGPNADWPRMEPYDRAIRYCDPLADEPSQPNTDIAQAFAEHGYHDAASLLLAKHPERTDVLGPTGKTDRIDAIHLSDSLTDAVRDYRRLSTPHGASNHHGIRIDLDFSGLT